jgi:hypothetical protein
LHFETKTEKFARSMIPPIHPHIGRLAAAALCALVFAGCREKSFDTYEAPRETAAASADPHAGMAGMPPSGMTAGAMPRAGQPTTAKLEWTKPAAWTGKPASEMRLASYEFTSADGTKADVSVFSFPDAAGGLLANINRWRGQVGLTPVNAPEESAARAEIAGQAAWLVDFVGTPTGAAPAMGATPPPTGPTRIIGAIVPVSGQAWFFKMMGPDATVAAQRPAFEELVASIRAVTPAAPASAPAPAPVIAPASPSADPHAGLNLPGLPATGTAGDPHAGLDMTTMAGGANLVPTPSAPAGFTFEVPAGWQQQPGSAMRVASFRVPGTGVRDADISVFALGGPAGGELANVNRWRGQLGLPPLDAATLTASATTVNAPGGVVFRVFEFESTAASADDNRPTRLLAAILPRGDRTWFVKMTGETASVAAQRPAFVLFLESFRFDAAP